MAQVTHPRGHQPRQENVGQSYMTQEAAAKALAAHLGVPTRNLLYKKAEFYKSLVAVMKAMKIFKLLQESWVRRKWIPGKLTMLMMCVGGRRAGGHGPQRGFGGGGGGGEGGMVRLVHTISWELILQ